MRLPPLLRLLRPHQWTKNFLVFAALIFTGSATDQQALAKALLAFAVFCLVSSATYAFNDVKDSEQDRLHPRKRSRPVAAGEVSKGLALAIVAILLASGLAIAYATNVSLLWPVGLYLLMQVFYNLGLRRVAVADAFTIAFGFVIRAVAGAVAIQEPISGWLLLCTGALALLIAFGKRRAELLADGSPSIRESLQMYTDRSLDALTCASAAAAVLCYGLYAIESPTARNNPALILTAPFVWFGVLRYLAVIIGKNEGQEPETLLFRDPGVLISIVGFVLVALWAVSGPDISWLEVESMP